jgi:O-antigen/teichoic acid export membrane protein
LAQKMHLRWPVAIIPGAISLPAIRQLGFSVVDQVLAVGGMFLVNISLARTQTKEAYGIFALSYSAFTLLAGLHNAAIVETYTIYGSGRYRGHFRSYSRLLWRSNLLLVIATTAALTLAWRLLAWVLPSLGSPTGLGMALACGMPLTALFLRRTFYMRRRPDLAARLSFVFFGICATLLWISFRAGVLSGFSAFLIVAAGWGLSATFMASELPGRAAGEDFMELEPRYWAEHWKYARWVLVTAFVFQLTTQGYYWLAAGLVSVKEVANLRALLNVVVPMDQVFTATNLLMLPMLCARYESASVAGVVSLWKVYCASWFAMTCAFAGIVNILGRPVMHFLYSGAFDDVSSLVGMLALLPLVMGIGHTINAALKAAERPDVVFTAYVFSGAVTFIAGVPLVTHLGLRGAVYGLITSGAAYTLALALGLWRVTSVGANWSAPLSSAS